MGGPSKRPFDEFVLLQKFDGSFDLNAALATAAGLPLDKLHEAQPKSLASLGKFAESIWANAIALAIFRKKYGKEGEEWDLLAAKIHRLINKALEGHKEIDAQELLKAAEALFN